MGARVLIVEDELHLVRLLRGYLEREGFEVGEAADGPAGLEAIRATQPEVVILDWMLPGMDGVEVLRRMRKFSEAYVVMLTARSEESDKIVGLSGGADDYLTKPFSAGELVARVRAVLRRSRGSGEYARELPQRVGDLVVDRDARKAHLGEEELDLTAREFDVLSALASRPGSVFHRERLLDAVWGPDHFGGGHVVEVHVANLRRKLGESADSPRYVETVRGVGYRFARL